VNDQGNEHSGDFLGWTLSLWGSSVDPAKAKAFVVPKLDSVFPPLHPDEAENHPVASKSIAEAATSAKTKNKPTAALPTDHGLAEGEAHKPAFPGASASATSASAPASATPTALEPTADEGWFPDMASLSGDRRWLGVALALVLLFLAGAGAFFWRRRIAARRRVQYAALGGAGGDDLPMRARGGTKELYDAFGAVSDDDEDADEETGLRPRAGGSGGPLGAQHDVGYHSGFLDDDEPASPGRAYRDDEPAEHAVEGLAPHGRGGSGSGSDGSWEHASQTR
jgi:kexin